MSAGGGREDMVLVDRLPVTVGRRQRGYLWRALPRRNRW